MARIPLKFRHKLTKERWMVQWLHYNVMEELSMRRIFGTLLFSAVLISPVLAVAQDRDHDRDHDQEHRYYDRDHKDYHNWNDHEDHAYRYYLQQNHREYRDLGVANARDQRNYWKWRHRHNDAWLQVNVR